MVIHSCVSAQPAQSCFFFHPPGQLPRRSDPQRQPIHPYADQQPWIGSLRSRHSFYTLVVFQKTAQIQRPTQLPNRSRYMIGTDQTFDVHLSPITLTPVDSLQPCFSHTQVCIRSASVVPDFFTASEQGDNKCADYFTNREQGKQIKRSETYIASRAAISSI